MLPRLLSALLATLFLVSSAHANNLDEHVAKLAKRIAAVCQEDGYTSVMIEFDRPKSTKAGNAAIVAGSGPQMLKTALAEQLKDVHKISVKRFRAAIRLVGEILIDEFGDEGGGGRTTGVALDVTVRFVDRQGEAAA